MAFSIQKPSVTVVTLTPNPTYMNTEIDIKVLAADITVILEEQTLPAGTFYAGEEWK